MRFKIVFALMLCLGLCSYAQQSKSNYHVKTIENVDNNNILSSITKNYKGEVTLIDFWATWCPPCRRAMTEIDKIKESYMKKGVKFVYVTGVSSPEATWKQMIQKIDGDHYRLTKDQWAKLGQQLGIRGIPCYLLLKKDGTTAFSNITSGGYPGNIKISAEMDKILK